MPDVEKLVTDAQDAIRLVECFRRLGVGHSKLHALMPRLQQLANPHGFDCMMDFNDEDAKEVNNEDSKEVAILMITSADLIIDINIHAASSLEGALLSLSITPSSAESDENFKPWAHVSADTIHAELLGCLRSADAAGFFRRLASLSRSYELIRRASADPVSLTSQWSAAAAALEHAIGVPAERCCEGLRSGYYIPPGHQGLGGNYEVLVCLRSVSEDDAAPPELQLELSPPLVVTEEVGRDLKALAAGDAAVAGGPAKTAKSGEAWLSALVKAPVTAAAGGMGVTTHGEIPMDAQGAQGCRGSVLRYAVVPLNGGIHRQKWCVCPSHAPSEPMTKSMCASWLTARAPRVAGSSPQTPSWAGR
jgi:hypothetical protein